MTEVQSSATELKAHYAAQVTADLERNAREQERIGAEVAALQEQLLALQQDQALLENMQQALGGPATATAPPAPEGTAAAPLQRQTRRKKSAAHKEAATKADTSAGKAAKADGQPTLGELIRTHLAEHPEPRSAKEITDSLGQSRPDRPVKATVVRTTVEGLVAKGHVERIKQGSSVFYTTASAPTDSPTAVTDAPDDGTT